MYRRSGRQATRAANTPRGVNRFVERGASVALVLALAWAPGCERKPEPLEPAETFTWVAQPIAFSPPSGRWERQGDNSGGTLGVRFILTNGGGQCISVAAYRLLAERDRRETLERLISRRDSLSRGEFLHELSLARARTDDPISEREAAVAADINYWLDRTLTHYLSDSPGSAAADLEAALRASSSYEPTLDELLPRIRLRPERMQEPERWRIGYERDTTLADLPAFASDDTLITPEDSLLYREVFCVVKGCAFKAVYQGTPEHLETFARLLGSVRFPEDADAAPH